MIYHPASSEKEYFEYGKNESHLQNVELACSYVNYQTNRGLRRFVNMELTNNLTCKTWKVVNYICFQLYQMQQYLVCDRLRQMKMTEIHFTWLNIYTKLFR